MNQGKTLKNAKILFFVGLVLIIVSPWIFTITNFWDRLNFSQTGQIGDTIGGITSPIVNLVGAGLVFFALQAQIEANTLLQNQLFADNIEKEKEKQTQNLNQLYTYLNESINNFKFLSLQMGFTPSGPVPPDPVLTTGSEGIYNLLSQILCDFHGTEDELLDNPCVAEFFSILEIFNLLLEKLQTTSSDNKEILTTLTKHQFQYRILTRIKNETIEDLKISFCKVCKHDHGIPDKMLALIESIKSKLG
ncbi:hypothetical protein [Ferruginibacter sp. HRS2-29]|uniref:hypothetical protein n=1 Tax=Ferruginibacter sp. HRS2-29 TaxID=2487334 RepID=UPI0020CEBB42|nr:hypothetical protein [Ferruginibacter sp. HRS2-29]MCP9752035.1 hypothetical protein [Ferruginibacter sp. HRS2-29]